MSYTNNYQFYTILSVNNNYETRISYRKTTPLRVYYERKGSFSLQKNMSPKLLFIYSEN